MNEYNDNEFEEFGNPYELEYSFVKSSKNESLNLQIKKIIIRIYLDLIIIKKYVSK